MAYVYRHIRLDKNEPFYIGIGETKYRHKAVGARRNIIWNRIVSKTDYDVEVLIDDITWDEACKKEKEFIKLYGRLDNGSGTLANMTDGGEGVVGVVVTEEMREKMRASRMGRIISDVTKQRIRASHLGVPHSDERRKNISNATKGRAANNRGCKMPKSQYESLLRRSEIIQRRVGKYGLDGNFIYEYKSAILAAKQNNLNQGNITNACNKKIGYGGYSWRYLNGEAEARIEPHDLRIKPIIQYDLNDNLIAEYESATEAAMANNWVKSTILRAAKRKNNIAYGFKWKFKNKQWKNQPPQKSSQQLSTMQISAIL